MKRQSKVLSWIGLSSGLLLIVYVSTLFSNRVESLSSVLYTGDQVADYLQALAWFFFICLFLVLMPAHPKLRTNLIILWLLRGFISLVVMLFYESHYETLDAFVYFRDGMARTGSWDGFRFGAGTENIKSLIGIVNDSLPIAHSYHSLKVLWSFFGLMGAYFMFLGLKRLSPSVKPWHLLVFGSIPSLAFWSSILGKDPVQFFAIGLFIYGALSWITDSKGAFFALVGIFLASSIRSWTGPIFLLPLIFAYLIKPVSKEHPLKRLIKPIVCLGLVVGAYLASSFVLESFKVSALDEIVEHTDKMSRSWSKGGSAQAIPHFNSASDLLIFAPLGGFTALFRPLPGEINNAFGLVAGLENIVILALFIWSLWAFIRFGSIRDPIFIWLISTIVIWAGIYGFVSSQNLGSAFRYRLQILPFLVMLFIYSKWKSNEHKIQEDSLHS